MIHRIMRNTGSMCALWKLSIPKLGWIKNNVKRGIAQWESKAECPVKQCPSPKCPTLTFHKEILSEQKTLSCSVKHDISCGTRKRLWSCRSTNTCVWWNEIGSGCNETRSAYIHKSILDANVQFHFVRLDPLFTWWPYYTLSLTDEYRA